MSSLSLRLLQKTCGLFDTGFAGSAHDAASLEVNAPVAEILPADDQFDLWEAFEPGKIVNAGDSLLQHPGVASTPALDKLTTAGQTSADADTTWDCDQGDLEADQLGDDSLDAFIDLNQLLMGDTFLDEIQEVQPEAGMKPQCVEPVISIPSPEVGGDHHQQQFDFFDLLDTAESNEVDYQVTLNPLPAVEPSVLPSTAAIISTAVNTTVSWKRTTAVSKKGKSRKRKAATPLAAAPVKTSMFEILDKVTIVGPSSPGLDDHDYTARPLVQVSTYACNNKNLLLPDKRAAVEMVDAHPGCSSAEFVAVPTPVEEVLDKQSIRRHKNNQASKRSREQRKQKFSELDREAEELIVKNEALRHKIVELERMAKDMKAALVAKMSGK